MFDTGYKCAYLGKSKMYPNGHLYRHVYKFRTHKDRKYVVWVDEHEHDTYIIKFFLQKNETAIDKFSLMANDNNASRVIYTCVNIMFTILEQTPVASFAFIGAETLEEKENHVLITKRFKIYDKLMKSKFGLIQFLQIIIPEKSSCLMFNNENKNVTAEQIADMLNKCYPELND